MILLELVNISQFRGPYHVRQSSHIKDCHHIMIFVDKVVAVEHVT